MAAAIQVACVIQATGAIIVDPMYSGSHCGLAAKRAWGNKCHSTVHFAKPCLFLRKHARTAPALKNPLLGCLTSVHDVGGLDPPHALHNGGVRPGQGCDKGRRAQRLEDHRHDRKVNLQRCQTRWLGVKLVLYLDRSLRRQRVSFLY